MTHLSEKIAKLASNEQFTGMPLYYDENEKIDWLRQAIISVVTNYNPIDYLYTEFEKLNK